MCGENKIFMYCPVPMNLKVQSNSPVLSFPDVCYVVLYRCSYHLQYSGMLDAALC